MGNLKPDNLCWLTVTPWMYLHTWTHVKHNSNANHNSNIVCILKIVLMADFRVDGQ